MSSRRAPAMRPMIFAPAMIGKAVFREGGARVGGQLDDLRVELAADPEGLDEQEVARDEGVLQSELLVRGHAAAAHLAAVVDIVVDQGRGVDELQGRGEVDRLRGVHAAEGPEGEEGDHRPDALAARLDHVAGDVMEEGFLGNDALADLRLDKGHLRGHAKIQGWGRQALPIRAIPPTYITVSGVRCGLADDTPGKSD